YQDQRDEDNGDSPGDVRLPPLSKDDPLGKKELKPEQHFTQPLPRFSEASLVKRLEELGIGRPSTYASIMQVLQDRDYVRLDKKRFIPEDRGRIVTAFLENFFRTYVEYDFTADLEGKLDDISGGKIKWKKVMADFWKDFSGAIDGTKDLKISDVIDALDEALGPHFFPPRIDGTDPRNCPLCGTGRLGLKLGKFGAFIGCSNYPTCRQTQPLAVTDENGNGAPQMAPRSLGDDPATMLPITVRIGPYGAYAQLGPAPVKESEEKPTDGKKKRSKKKASDAVKPKRVSLPKGIDPNLINLDTAIALLNLPRKIGPHPDTGEMITAGIGRFGSYIKMGPRYKNITDADDILSIGMNRAVALLAEPDKENRRGGQAGKALGNHPEDGKAVSLNSGRFGPYVKWGKVMATVTKSYDPESLTLEQAMEILAAKIAKGPSPGKSKTKAKAVKKDSGKKKGKKA
ncbi:MAG: topoisomerase C-terminal repeat-containing protein, partial [Alphaproteobacteria bacterium]|nr:topoisomerase C-terminal repeat-containing protein [Alphaproteobacteria bacterium]